MESLFLVFFCDPTSSDSTIWHRIHRMNFQPRHFDKNNKMLHFRARHDGIFEHKLLDILKNLLLKMASDNIGYRKQVERFCLIVCENNNVKLFMFCFRFSFYCYIYSFYCSMLNVFIVADTKPPCLAQLSWHSNGVWLMNSNLDHSSHNQE